MRNLGWNLNELMRQKSKSRQVPVIALVGYTNAGKTALMNLIAGSSLESEDMLF
jgi:GTP-binding protein HflX